MSSWRMSCAKQNALPASRLLAWLPLRRFSCGFAAGLWARLRNQKQRKKKRKRDKKTLENHNFTFILVAGTLFFLIFSAFRLGLPVFGISLSLSLSLLYLFLCFSRFSSSVCVSRCCYLSDVEYPWSE